MMSILDQIGKKVTDTGKGIAQQTKNLADVTKLNGMIAAEEKNINQLYTELGKAYYELNQDNEQAVCAEKIAAIGEAAARIEQWKEQINEIKGILVCPNCGLELPDTAAFCSECGAKLNKKPEPIDENICQECGAPVEPHQKFCTQCGTVIVRACAEEETEAAAEELVEEAAEAAEEIAEEACCCGETVEETAEAVEEAAEAAEPEENADEA